MPGEPACTQPSSGVVHLLLLLLLAYSKMRHILYLGSNPAMLHARCVIVVNVLHGAVSAGLLTSVRAWPRCWCCLRCRAVVMVSVSSLHVLQPSATHSIAACPAARVHSLLHQQGMRSSEQVAEQHDDAALDTPLLLLLLPLPQARP